MNALNTPVLFLIFNRPETTRLVFEAIRKVKPKQLFIAADGPRANKEGEAEKCLQTRLIVENIDWDCSVKTLFRDKNMGCGKAVSGAISWFFEHVEEGIILEDDCLPNNSFFEYCATMLDYYRNNEKVMFISGDSALSEKFADPKNETYYFSAIPRVWGWATWKKCWDSYIFDFSKTSSYSFHKKLKNYFDDKRMINFWRWTFFRMQHQDIDTWDYQWGFSIWMKNGLAVTPFVNMISNIGFGTDATHTTGDEESTRNNLPVYEIESIIHPQTIKQNKELDLLMLSKEYRGRSTYRLYRDKLRFKSKKKD